MNHIYKIIWNHTRACWQVVSELAKNSGRVKSIRRRVGAAPGGSPSWRLAAVLAITLACWPGGTPGIVQAADSVTVSGTQTTGDADNGHGGTGGSYMTTGNSNNIYLYDNMLPGSTNMVPPTNQTTYRLTSFSIGKIGFLTETPLTRGTPLYNRVLQLLQDMKTNNDQSNSAGWLAKELARIRQDATDPLYPYIAGMTKSQYFIVNVSSASTTVPPAAAATAYDAVGLTNGAVWRPLDWSLLQTYDAILNTCVDGVDYSNVQILLKSDGKTFNGKSATADPITDGSSKGALLYNLLLVNNLETGAGATVDLAYLNTGGDTPRVSTMRQSKDGGQIGSGLDAAGNRLDRTLYVKNATLAEGTTFNLGLYSVYTISGTGQGSDSIRELINGVSRDSVFIEKAAQTANADGKTNLYVRLGWVPGLDLAGSTHPGGSGKADIAGDIPVMLGILEGGGNFTVTGQAGYADGLFSKYYITPVIKESDNYYVTGGTSPNFTYGGTAWYLDSYSYYYAGISESGRSAADNAVPVRNLWRNDYLDLFRRAGALHRENPFAPAPDRQVAGGSDGVKAGRPSTDPASDRENVWAEAWTGKFSSASSYGRSLDQSYNAFQVGYDKRLDKDFYHGQLYTGLYLSKKQANSDTAAGSGDQESDGVGLYASWVGNKGHYLDLGLQASRLDNDFHFTDTSGRVNGDYATWGYGLGAQYGYRKALPRGWFLEPQAALFYGRLDGSSYLMSNQLKIHQASGSALTGKLGLAAGKVLSGGSSVYARAAALRDFRGWPAMTMQYGLASQPVDTAGGKDTWYELGLGGSFRLSPTGSFNLDLARTVGSSLGDEWRAAGLMKWSWGAGGKAAGQPDRSGDAGLQAPAAPAAPAALPGGEAAGGTAGGNADSPASAGAGRTDAGQAVASGENAAAGAAAGEFRFAPVTVEAPRPAWESTLSPGQVSVIYPQQYKGEQKTLPDLLERVPGMFVQRVNGVGHYNVARLRASTSAEVSVYVDGVLMNLNGDAAVNLSTIPVENVERIEVYRGYIPARFSGSPLGGVINIVTKKPDRPGWYVKEGSRSYGGYQGSYEYNAPLGRGTLLTAYNRDIWRGDFPFKARWNSYAYGGSPNITLKRRGNDYQNSDGLLKWQDDHWQVKASWKKNCESLPYSFGYEVWDPSTMDYFRENRYKQLTVEQKEFQVGRRDTAGNLDWGWRLNYLDSRKDFAWPYYLMHGVPAYINAYPGDLWSSYRSRKWGTNLNGALKMGGSHLLEMTAEFSHETMDGNGSNWDVWNSGSYAISQGRIYIHHYGIDETHLSLQDTVTLNRAGDLKLTPVLHADKVDMATMSASDRRWQYSGGVGLRKDLNDRWTVKTTWGTYNRHPNFYEIFGDGATIKPNTGLMNAWNLAGNGTWESGSQFDFGVDWKGRLAGADGTMTLAWFQRDSKNQLVLSVPPMQGATASYLALDATKAHGLELTSRLNWRRVSLDLSTTWTKTAYTGKWFDIEHGAELPWMPQWVVNARLEYRLPGDRLSLFSEYHYTGEQYIDYSSSKYTQSRLSALGTFNLGLKYKLSRETKLTLGVNDLFDKGYDQVIKGWGGGNIYPFYPLPGRVYYATLEYRL